MILPEPVVRPSVGPFGSFDFAGFLLQDIHWIGRHFLAAFIVLYSLYCGIVEAHLNNAFDRALFSGVIVTTLYVAARQVFMWLTLWLSI